jgi:S-adenosylmethionine:tRNA ribosyltransferase-isomerase
MAPLATTFDFVLPAELEASAPPEARGLARDQVRLLVSHREKDGVVHARFADLPRFLRPGDLLVVNDSATLPAALRARRALGDEVAMHLSTPLPGGAWAGGGAPDGRPFGRLPLGRLRTRPERSEGAGRIGSPATDHGRPLPRDAWKGDEAESADSGYAALAAPAPLAYHLWLVEPRRAQVTAGEVLELPGGARATVLAPHAPHAGAPRLWLARLEVPERLIDYLHRWGKPIAYPYVRGEWPLAAYQTMFAREPGSAEMPSAGRAFTPRVVDALRRRGVRLARLTLHTGVASAERDEPPYAEFYRVPVETAAAVRQARAAGGRVIAVGTTVVRALESAAGAGGRVAAASGWTDLVITPERGVRAVDGLLTGFHEPRATHLAMLEAIAGQTHVRMAYRAALDGRYLWHEFGDLHLIL